MDVAALLAEKKRRLGHHVEYLRETLQKAKVKSEAGPNDKSVQQLMQLLDVVTSDRKVLSKVQIEVTNKLISEKRWPGQSKNQNENVSNDSSRDHSRDNHPSKEDDSHAPGTSNVSRDPRIQRNQQARESHGSPFEAHTSYRNDPSIDNRSGQRRFRNSPERNSRSPIRFLSRSPSFFNKRSRSPSRPRYPENSGHQPERPSRMGGDGFKGYRSQSRGRSLARVAPDEQFKERPAGNEFEKSNSGRPFWMSGYRDHPQQSRQADNSGRLTQFPNSRNFSNSNEEQSMRFHNNANRNSYEHQKWQEAKSYGEHAPVQIQVHLNSYNQRSRTPSMHPETVGRQQSPTAVAKTDPCMSRQSRDPRLNRPADSHRMQVESSVRATIDFETEHFNSGFYRDNFNNFDPQVEPRSEKQISVAPRRRLSCHEMKPHQVPPVKKMNRRMSVHHTVPHNLTKDALSSPRFQMPKKTVVKAEHVTSPKNENLEDGNVRKKVRLSSLESTGSFSVSSDNSKGSLSTLSSYKIPKKNQQTEQAQCSSSTDQKPTLEFGVIETVKNFVENVAPKTADKPEDLVKEMEKALGTETFLKIKSLLVKDVSVATEQLTSVTETPKKVAEASNTNIDARDVPEVKESKAKLKSITKIETSKPSKNTVVEGKVKVKESEKKIEKVKAKEPERKISRLSISSAVNPSARSKASHNKVSSKSVETKKLDPRPIDKVKNQLKETKPSAVVPLSSRAVIKDVATVSTKVTIKATQEASEIKQPTASKVKKYKNELDRLQDYNNDSVDLRDGVMKAYLPRVCTKANHNEDANESTIFKKHGLKKVEIVVESLNLGTVPMPILLTEEFARKYPQLRQVIKPFIRKPNTKSLAELLQQDEEDEDVLNSSGTTTENLGDTPPATLPKEAERKSKVKNRKSRRNMSWSRGVIVKTPTKKKVKAVKVNSEDEWEDVETEEPSKKQGSEGDKNVAKVKFTKFVKLMDIAAKVNPQTKAPVKKLKSLESSKPFITPPAVLPCTSKPVANLVQLSQATVMTTTAKSLNFEIKTGRKNNSQEGPAFEFFVCRIARCGFSTGTGRAFINHVGMFHGDVFWNRKCSLCNQIIDTNESSMLCELLHYLSKHRKVETTASTPAATPIPAKPAAIPSIKPASKPLDQNLIDEKTAKIITVSGKPFALMMPTSMVKVTKNLPGVPKTSTSLPTKAVQVVAKRTTNDSLKEMQSKLPQKQHEIQDKADQHLPKIKIRSLPGDKLSTSSAFNTEPIQSPAGSSKVAAVAPLLDETWNTFVVPKLLPQEPKLLPLTNQSIRPWFNRIEQKSDALCRKMLMNTKCLAALFKCMGSTCSFYTNDRDIFECHIGLHEKFQLEDKENFLMCSYCEETVTDSKALFEHIFNVHGSNKFQCGYCFYRAHVEFYVTDLHQKVCHEGQKKMLIECEQLKPLELGEERQIMKNLFQIVPPFVCIHCNKQFYYTERFMAHLKTHPSDKSMRCVKCQQVMNAESILQHYYICHGYGEYQCIYCKHGAKNSQEMEKHLFEKHPNNSARFCTRKESKSRQSGSQQASLEKPNALSLTTKMIHKPAIAVVPIKHLSEELKNEENIGKLSSNLIIDINNGDELGLNGPNDFLKIGSVFSLSETHATANAFEDPFDDDFFTDIDL